MSVNKRATAYEIRLGREPWSPLPDQRRARFALLGTQVHLKIKLDGDTEVYLPPDCWRLVTKEKTNA